MAAAIVTALAVGLGGGDLLWLSLPAAVLAAALAQTRGEAAAGVALVVGSALAAAAVHGGRGGRPSPALLLGVAAASAAIVAAMRERLVRERDLLRAFALADPLTGVANRRSLLLRADYEIGRHRRGRQSFALVMIDLDGFKPLNDRFGHAAGDDLLRDVAASLTRAMREQDTVARLGGDEFCVLAPETDERGMGRLATRVSAAVREASAGMDGVSGSVGISLFPRDGVTAAEVMEAADKRLLAAKRRRHERQPAAGRRAA